MLNVYLNVFSGTYDIFTQSLCLSGNDDPLKNNSLIVTNLAFSTTKDQLQEYFEDGTVRIAVERKRGNSLG